MARIIKPINWMRDRIKMKVWLNRAPGRSVLVGLVSAVAAAAITLVLLSGGTGRRELLRKTDQVDTGRSLPALLALSTERRAAVDVAEVNLCCALGLPGAENLDMPGALRRLNSWAEQVEMETERHLYRFRRNPAEFNQSEAYFRVLTLVTVLREDCGVHYNPGRIQAPDFSDSRDLFLHGLLTGQHQGTCVSMPVLYVAVGRRLGYPLKLGTAKAHLFARWESLDGKERFNIEATGQGLNCFPDEYYHTWPVPLTPEEVASEQYLKSLTPGEEMAVFLSVRGHCLEMAGRLPEAQEAYAQAHRLAPKATHYLAFLAAAVKREMPEWERIRINLGQAQNSQVQP